MHQSGVARTRTDSAGLVRCLDCGTEYWLELKNGEADPCPYCAGIGWIALDACTSRGPEEKMS